MYKYNLNSMLEELSQFYVIMNREINSDYSFCFGKVEKYLLEDEKLKVKKSECYNDFVNSVKEVLKNLEKRIRYQTKTEVEFVWNDLTGKDSSITKLGFKLMKVQSFINSSFETYTLNKWHQVSENDLPERNDEKELDRRVWCKYQIGGNVEYRELVYNFVLKKFVTYHLEDYDVYNVLVWCELPKLEEN